MGQEIEIKRLLDAPGYERLRAHLNTLVAPESHQQLNHYLDLPGAALREAGAMLRLRTIGERMELTLKARASVEAGVMSAQELECALLTPYERAFWLQRPVPWSQVAVRIAEWLDATGLAHLSDRDVPLHEVGTTENLRHIYRLENGLGPWQQPLTLELDKTRYPSGAERLELECEHALALEIAPLLDAWLQALGVPATQATETKYAQFLRLAAHGGG
jgi:uncharacterized protein YjbK